MGDRLDQLRNEELALHQQSQQLYEQEVELYAQEEGVVQMERSFLKRNRTLLKLLSYVANQEANLMRQAADIGPKAKELALERLGAHSDLGNPAEIIGKPESRESVVERRRELLAARSELIEDRQQIYNERLEALEAAESQFGDLENRIQAREKLIAGLLKELVMNAEELGDEDGDGEDEEPASSRPDVRAGPARAASAPVVAAPAKAAAPATSAAPEQVAAPAPVPASEQVTRVEMRAIKGQETPIEGGSIAHPRPVEHVGAKSRAEDTARHKRAKKGKGRAPYVISLETVLDEGAAHRFFRYRDDPPSELPGLFVATENLLAEGREVRLKIRLGSGDPIDVPGVVSWRKEERDGEGPEGMGIEIGALNEGDGQRVMGWLAAHPPLVV